MRFIDEAIITVQSGNGGRGCVSFRREKYVPRGGPDGGDGGKGGDVIFISTTRRRTLQQFRYKREFKALNGAPGSGGNKTGKDGDDLIIEIPAGTQVTDLDSGQPLKDFTQNGQQFCPAKGGRGGQGNQRFKTSTRRAPRFAQPGEPGQRLTLKLELKLLADVGLIGLPNAGKSTLISVMSAAKPKIADYPFTTLTPILGVVADGVDEPFVVADIPGLIQGAHEGAGLGTKFLKHIERTRVLVHLIDANAIAPDDPLADYRTINGELGKYTTDLTRKPRILVLNKLDLPQAGPNAAAFIAAAKKKGLDVMTISAVSGQGLAKLKTAIINILGQHHED